MNNLQCFYKSEGRKIQKVIKDNRFIKIVGWSKIFALTASTQLIIQVIGFISGIIIIRVMPTAEYAFYTLANTMLGTMTILSDAGIATGVMAEGGKVWSDKKGLSAVLSTGFHLRRQFITYSLLFSLPVLLYLLIQHHAGPLITVLIIASVIPAFLAAMSDSILEIALKLHQNIIPLQKNQLNVGIGRLIMTVVGVFAFPFAFVAILANGIPRILGNIRLKKLVVNITGEIKGHDEAVKKRILKLVKRRLPDAIYFCLSTQITIWIISIFGSTKSLAEVGALGRIGAMVALITTVCGTIIVPRFARLPDNGTLLFRRFLQAELLVLAICVFIVSGVWFFSDQILWILGKQYYGLNNELVLAIAGNCINLAAAVTFSLYSGRGWMMNPAISITISVVAILFAVFIIDVTSLRGVLVLNIITSSVSALMHIIYGLRRIYTKKKHPESAAA